MKNFFECLLTVFLFLQILCCSKTLWGVCWPNWVKSQGPFEWDFKKQNMEPMGPITHLSRSSYRDRQFLAKLSLCWGNHLRFREINYLWIHFLIIVQYYSTYQLYFVLCFVESGKEIKLYNMKRLRMD